MQLKAAPGGRFGTAVAILFTEKFPSVRADRVKSGARWAMKSRLITKLAIMALVVAGAFSISALAQTPDDGTGPTEQPSAPMEGSAPQAPVNVQESNIPPNGQASPSAPGAQGDQAQPTEAQPGGPTGEAPAKSDLGVARISLIHGTVSTQRGDSGDWSAATLNQPVMGGDKVSTGDNSRMELQLDFANVFRLGPNSTATIATLTHKDIQIQFGQGIANYTVSKDSEAEPEIDMPNVALHPAHHDGVFRIEVRPDGDTVIIVRQGEAQISTPQGSAEIHSGDMATIRGDANSAQYKVSNAPDRDDWDQWNADRDHMIRDSEAWKHTNRYYTGSEDLDAYGKWENVPDYGDVWVPSEPDGWAPYRDGSWTWEPYYGWTWVGYEPWGWAPYHYGRWFWYGGGWAWWPGPVGGFYRPFWAPAYVSFWGWGGGFGFGFGWGGWGGFGWLPLGPCDWFHPWWGGYGGRFGWVGRGWGYGGYGRWGGHWGGFAPLHGGTRFSNVANLHDPHIAGGLSAVGAGRFGAGRVTAMAATREQISGAHMMAGNLPVVPTRASLSASGRPAAASTMGNGGSQRFFGSVHTNAAHPESFQQQTAGLRQTMAQNHVSSFSAGGRGGEFAARSGSRPESTMGSMQKPSAGMTSTREANSFGNRSAGSEAQSVNRGAIRPFTPPNSSNTRLAEPGNASRGASQFSGASRDGFRPFTPPPGSSASRGGSGSGNYWNRTAPSSMERGYGSYGSRAYEGGGRPQLDMRQPIVRSPSYGGPRSGYSGSRPSYNAPRSGGSHSAPSGGHSSGGGGHAGGGGSHGGGGHGGGGHR
jgi:hypothetical protein